MLKSLEVFKYTILHPDISDICFVMCQNDVSIDIL